MVRVSGGARCDRDTDAGALDAGAVAGRTRGVARCISWCSCGNPRAYEGMILAACVDARKERCAPSRIHRAHLRTTAWRAMIDAELEAGRGAIFGASPAQLRYGRIFLQMTGSARLIRREDALLDAWRCPARERECRRLMLPSPMRLADCGGTIWDAFSYGAAFSNTRDSRVRCGCGAVMEHGQRH